MTVKAVSKAPPGASPLWTGAWIGWIGVFFALELPPLLRGRPQDTLSDHVWSWAGIPRRSAPSGLLRVRRFALLAGLAWIGTHFLSGDEF